nr:alpha/beta hydrolase [Rubripirellula sp.]
MNSRSMFHRLAIIGLILSPLLLTSALADEVQLKQGTKQDTKQNEKEEGGPLNLAWKTTGGMQFWTDHVHRQGFRIQQNVITGHWRLLDPDNIRLSWGRRSTCEGVLDRKCKPTATLEDQQSYVVLLHGLMRTRGSMNSLERELKKKDFKNVIRFSYASTRGSIANHASALRDVLEHLPKNSEFRFVGHSMGNIVVRHLLGDLRKDDPNQVAKRCKSMVMLGPPNQGALIAKRLAPTGVFGWITGEGGLELGPDWKNLEKRLDTPKFPFAIVAGDVSDQPIQNPLTKGSGDLVVSVEEARLDGSKWLKTVPVLHSFLMDNEEVQKMTMDFLTQY